MAAGVLGFGATQAIAASPACGDVITSNVKLKTDLAGCPNHGLVIGADHVSVNLNGHTISGDATETECPEGTPCDVGILNDDGHRDVKVFGGTLRDFSGGFVAVGARSNRLRDLTTINQFVGVVLDSSAASTVQNNVHRDGGTGVVLSQTTDSDVTRNVVSGGAGFGIFLSGSNNNRVEDNRLRGNEHGIAVQEGSSRNTVRRNLVSDGGGSSIDVGGNAAAANRIEQNRITNSGDGIVLGDTQDNVVRRNLVIGAGGPVGSDAGGFGLILDGADRNLIDRNIVTGGRGPAILVTSLERAGTEDNFISRNVASSTLDDAIRVDNGATGTRIDRNTAIDSGDDGVDVDVASTTLVANTASRNADLGIEAVPGVIDGGGNRAFANGNPAQCTNVLCSS